MKKAWWAAAGLVLVVAGVGGAFVFKGQAASAPGARQAAGGKGGDGQGAKPPVPLEFAPAEVVTPLRQPMPASVAFSGALVAPETAVLRAKASGTLLSLAVGEGSRVRRGQVLGTLELADLPSRMAERAALLESARAALAQAERTQAQNERLAQQQFISSAALEASRSAVETARAQVAAAQAALATTRSGLRDATLVAPIAGIVARRHALPGEKLAPEQQVLTLIDISRLELAGMVGTHEVGRLQPGMVAQIRVEGVDEPVQGRIARIAPAAEPGTRSIGVTVDLPNPRETLRAGQYAMARVTLADTTPRLTLPGSAVGSTAGQNHVWVIADGQLMRRAVVLGRRDERDGRVEIVEGVTDGSVVLAAKFDNLREGAPAAVVAAKGAPVASAAASTAVLR